MKKQLLACVLVCGSVLAHAQVQEPSKARFVGRIGMGFGSAALDSGFYTDGSTWEVSSGNGLKYALGADYRLGKNFTLQATIGKEQSTLQASNAELMFSRTPVELLGFIDVNKEIRFGLGVRKSTNPQVTGSGVTSNNASVGAWDSSVGGVLELQYILDTTERQTGGPGQFGVNLRYVSETFTKGAVSKIADHFELGLFLNY